MGEERFTQQLPASPRFGILGPLQVTDAGQPGSGGADGGPPLDGSMGSCACDLPNGPGGHGVGLVSFLLLLVGLSVGTRWRRRHGAASVEARAPSRNRKEGAP